MENNEIDLDEFMANVRNAVQIKFNVYTDCIKKFYVLSSKYNVEEADNIMVDFFKEYNKTR